MLNIKFHIADMLIVVVVLLGLFLSIFLPSGVVTFIYSTFTLFFVGYFVNTRSSVHMMYFLGFVTFLYLPALVNWVFLNTSFIYLFITSVLSILFLNLTYKTDFKIDLNNKKKPYFLFLFISILSVLLILAGYGDLITYLIPFLIMLMVLSFSYKKKLKNYFLFSVFFLVFVLYVLLSWGGFGRVVVFGWLLIALLYLAYSLDFYPNKYLFSILPGLASTLLAARDVLNLKFSGFQSAIEDSAYSPYRLATSFIEYYNSRGLDFLGFFDQVIFTLFVYIPRDIWPSKPFGFGFEFTVRHLDSYLVNAGHSVASTLIGDHIYYLGYWGILTGAFMLFVFSKIIKLLYRLKGLNGNGVILFSTSMMVLVWGGMSSFSARIALASILFFLLYFLLISLIDMKFFLIKGRK